MSIEGVMMPASTAVAMLAVTDAGNQLRQQRDKIEEPLYDRLSAITANVGHAVEEICDTGKYSHLCKGRGLTIIIADDSAQAGAIDLDLLMDSLNPEARTEFFKLPEGADLESGTYWSVLYGAIKENNKSTGALALLMMGEKGTEAWRQAIKEALATEATDVPVFIVMITTLEDPERGSLIGGISFLIPFPIALVKSMEQKASVARAVHEMKTDLHSLN